MDEERLTRIDSNSEVDGGEDDEASESGSGSGSKSEDEDEDEILVSTIPDLNRGQSEYQKVSSAKCMLGV